MYFDNKDEKQFRLMTSTLTNSDDQSYNYSKQQDGQKRSHDERDALPSSDQFIIVLIAKMLPNLLRAHAPSRTKSLQNALPSASVNDSNYCSVFLIARLSDLKRDNFQPIIQTCVGVSKFQHSV